MWLRSRGSREKKEDEVAIHTEEYQQLLNKIVGLDASVAMLTNSIAVLDSTVKGLRARVNKLKVDEIIGEGESINKDDTVYLGGEGRYKP